MSPPPTSSSWVGEGCLVGSEGCTGEGGVPKFSSTRSAARGACRSSRACRPPGRHGGSPPPRHCRRCRHHHHCHRLRHRRRRLRRSLLCRRCHLPPPESQHRRPLDAISNRRWRRLHHHHRRPCCHCHRCHHRQASSCCSPLLEGAPFIHSNVPHARPLTNARSAVACADSMFAMWIVWNNTCCSRWTGSWPLGRSRRRPEPPDLLRACCCKHTLMHAPH